MKVFLAGPIDFWWNENWETPAHIEYMEWRDSVKTRFVEAGHVVYLPHQAIKGAWDESMQVINDTAIKVCDIFVYMTPRGVPAYGTAKEKEFAEIIGKRVFWAPPGDSRTIDPFLDPLDDPYGDVNRKSYTKVDNAASGHITGPECEIYTRPDGVASCETHCVWIDETC